MTKWTQQMQLLMEVEAIAYKGELYSEVSSKTFTKGE